MNKNLELNFLAHFASLIMFSFRHTSSVCRHKKMILSYRMGQKLTSKLFSYLYQILMDFIDFIIFYKVV